MLHGMWKVPSNACSSQWAGLTCIGCKDMGVLVAGMFITCTQVFCQLSLRVAPCGWHCPPPPPPPRYVTRSLIGDLVKTLKGIGNPVRVLNEPGEFYLVCFGRFDLAAFAQSHLECLPFVD
jgi:hypothetical protein